MTAASDDDSWLEDWLSPPRFAVYVNAADGDRGRARQLYEWNAAVSAAFHHDLGHLEVALRNAYDRALSQGGSDRRHWVFDPFRHFPPQMRRAANGRRYDANETSRVMIQRAVDEASKDSAGVQPAPGKVIAELNFGFWRFLSVRRLHESLWVPRLHTAFRPGTSRREVDDPVVRLHKLRNRVAHHEPLFALDLAARCTDVLTVASLLSEPLHAFIEEHSSCWKFLAERP
ncbi:hypothetical protein PSU4_60930 [Pseudonocardia sulfidoxydans NBRC 16205]|uniref:Abi-like protein n=1 Tax=Pseudonocardia sulfidoxydans NBRC 16205 TaxID=1223511 RepID=A0A511DQR7_9PSEU|nr:hypothetical protein [Pseudonocardia sulfidoxydans]GEL27139.1 hypothetical protein PSU4_60930 [Pseudonocardia sulfidoxydans NBRC 16205]